MNICNSCAAWLQKGLLRSELSLERSFTKIKGTLHIGFDRADVCTTINDYIPETIILAGDGAVEIEKQGGSCWKLLEKEMRILGLLGPLAYQKDLDGLTWLAAQNDFLRKTVNNERALEPITDLKRKIIKALHGCDTIPREMHCHSCTKKLKVIDSQKTLIITTNWDLGIFRTFSNVIQLHGRCDYPDEAILPLQNISSLMAQDIIAFKNLNCGIFPGPFLQKCLENTKNFVFWGTGLNDYDAALWHFLRGFLARNRKVKIGIATRDNAKSFEEAKNRTERFFPTIPINDCVCHMLGSR